MTSKRALISSIPLKTKLRTLKLQTNNLKKQRRSQAKKALLKFSQMKKNPR
jgi:hypothetical protein